MLTLALRVGGQGLLWVLKGDLLRREDLAVDVDGFNRRLVTFGLAPQSPSGAVHHLRCQNVSQRVVAELILLMQDEDSIAHLVKYFLKASDFNPEDRVQV